GGCGSSPRTSINAPTPLSPSAPSTSRHPLTFLALLTKPPKTPYANVSIKPTRTKESKTTVYCKQTLTKDELGKFCGRPAHIDDFVFEMISHSVIIRDRHHVLGGIDTDLLHPFGVHIQAARPLLHYFGVKFLPFLTEKPIDENL